MANFSADPCDDLWNYACGKLLENRVMDDYVSRWSWYFEDAKIVRQKLQPVSNGWQRHAVITFKILSAGGASMMHGLTQQSQQVTMYWVITITLYATLLAMTTSVSFPDGYRKACYDL